MAGGQWEPKQALIDQIRRTMINGESGMFTILTDNRRSIMFRFSEGRLIHSHCRSRDVNEAITALSECTELKFSYSSTQPKDQQEVIAADAFLQAIAPDELIGQPMADIVTESKTRPLVERTDTPVADEPSPSAAFNQRVAELENSGDEAVPPEEPEEEKPAKTDHRLFF